MFFSVTCFSQNKFLHNEDKITVFQNEKVYNFEIYGNNNFVFEDSLCIVFFSPCGNCCAEYSIIILNPEPHLKVYQGTKDIDYQNHYLVKEDSKGRIAAMNFLNEEIFWAKKFSKGNSKNGDCVCYCSLTNNILSVSFDEIWIPEKALIPPYKPNETYTFKLPVK